MAALLLRRNPKFPLPFPLFFSTTPSPSSIKSLIRSEPNPSKIADLFESATPDPTFHGDRELYKLAVQRLTRSRRPDLVERILEKSLTDPACPKSEGFLVRIISLYADARMLDHAVRTFDHMDCPRTERSLCALLTAYLRNRQLDRLREAFEEVPGKVGITPTVVSYNILIKSLCVKDDILGARKLLDEMRNKGVKPDIISYNTILNEYLRRGDDVGFDGILKEIREKGLTPNVVTYNGRIMALCKKGKSLEAEEILDVMVLKKVDPSRLSFNSLINGFCKEGDVASAMRILGRMVVQSGKEGGEGASPNSETYHALLPALVEKGEFDSALEICKKSLDNKWAPNFRTMKGLIDGLAKGSRVDEAKDVAKKMKGLMTGDSVDAWKKIEGGLFL